MKTTKHATAVVLAAALAACGGQAKQDQYGALAVGARGSALHFEASVKCVNVLVQPNGAVALQGQMFNSNPGKEGGAWEFKVEKLPIGPTTVTATAYSGGPDTACSGEALYAGSATVNVTNNGTAQLVLWLQDQKPANPFKNSAPYLTSLHANSVTVTQGDAIQLVAAASDADNDALAFAWAATGGTFASPEASSTKWTAPAQDGTYALTVSVSDGKGGTAAASIQVNVAAANGRGAIETTVNMNNWPQVSGIVASNTESAVGQPIEFEVSATDADGEQLSYIWSSTCGGAFSGEGAAVAFTPAAQGDCTVTVKVTDPPKNGVDSFGSGSVTFTVGAMQPAVGPQFMVKWLSPFSMIDPDGAKRAELTAIPLDNDISTKTFTWSDGAFGGSFVPYDGAFNNGPMSDVFYIPAACSGPGTLSIPLTIVVTDNATQATNSLTTNMAITCN
jgi:hypothetical protein